MDPAITETIELMLARDQAFAELVALSAEAGRLQEPGEEALRVAQAAYRAAALYGGSDLAASLERLGDFWSAFGSGDFRRAQALRQSVFREGRALAARRSDSELERHVDEAELGR